MRLGFIEEVHKEDLLLSVCLPHMQALLIVGDISLGIGVPKDGFDSTSHVLLVLSCESVTELKLLRQFLLKQLLFGSIKLSHL